MYDAASELTIEKPYKLSQLMAIEKSTRLVYVRETFS